MDKDKLKTQLEELLKLSNQLKKDIEITPEITKSYESLIVSIHKFYDEQVIPIVLESFVCRDDAEDYNWGLYTILNFFRRTILLDHLRKALASENCGTRLWAMILLRKSKTFGLTKEKVEQDFVFLLADPEQSVRYETLVSLALCSDNPISYINESFVKDSSTKIKVLVDKLREGHLKALHYLLAEHVPFSKRVEEMSGKVLNDVDELIQVIAAFKHESSIPLLLQAYLPYEDDELGSNKTIEKMLDHYTDEQLLPYLQNALVNGNEGSQAISILMLGAISDPNFAELIKPFVHHKNEFIRLKVIEGCSLSGDSASKSILQEMVKRDPSAIVREEADIALEMFNDE